MLTIIVPVYNETAGLELTIKQLLSLQEKFSSKIEILLIDDGSNEETKKILRNAETLPSFSIIEHINNLGYGAALKTGIRKATYDIIAITDADGTYPNERIPELFFLLREKDYAMVVGNRLEKKSITFRNSAKWFLSKLANFLTGTIIPDLNSGLRIMKKEHVLQFIRLLPNGFSFTTTITLAMLTNGLNVKYEPIDYFKRQGKSKIRPIYDTLNFIQLILRTILYFNPLKIFIPLSLTLVAMAFVILSGSIIYLGKGMDVTFGILIMTSVMVLAIGMLADLIDKRS